ncbi:uncharacterized protein TRIVIDRAFT_65277 [Trichoderma virens Gv29-8]|uniref:Uncharacterized protein n=1 Tax=Hypocrea virens (strain Gv29-8 / FGSC 10586) TaxID=413071 RepID=G9NAN0_HYPVG|nr:uncharacterized protein TRIVIDRAFT_65277 [Trichoderma virens Gv29-8]EHK15891.1 hypothetical protein TRIVIDRAFT_65277 [Trichoderma virens Gv29-8]UKZ56341.1 hypothetical protein TrVGV298_010177 [Trichoderma virens]
MAPPGSGFGWCKVGSMRKCLMGKKKKEGHGDSYMYEYRRIGWKISTYISQYSYISARVATSSSTLAIIDAARLTPASPTADADEQLHLGNLKLPLQPIRAMQFSPCGYFSRGSGSSPQEQTGVSLRVQSQDKHDKQFAAFYGVGDLPLWQLKSRVLDARPVRGRSWRLK